MCWRFCLVVFCGKVYRGVLFVVCVKCCVFLIGSVLLCGDVIFVVFKGVFFLLVFCCEWFWLDVLLCKVINDLLVIWFLFKDCCIFEIFFCFE